MIRLDQIHLEIGAIAPINGLRQIGDDIEIDFAENATEQQRSSAAQALETLPLKLAKSAKLQELSTACNFAIVSGFTSDALGTPHHYAGEPENQLNLIGAKSAGVDMPYTCTNIGTNEKKQVLHTAAQIGQVFADGMGFKQLQTQRFHQLRSLVELASSVEEVDAIVWQQP